jgi:DNA-binding transcriptional regulator YdaS (Cro superfamily)
LSKGGKIDVALLKLLVENSKGRVTPAELRPDVDWTFFATTKPKFRSVKPAASAAKSSSTPASTE